MKKLFISCVFLFLIVTLNAQKKDVIQFPLPIYKGEELAKTLKPKINYPKFAKSKFLQYVSFVDVKIDITGKLVESKLTVGENEMCAKIPLFDTNALNLVNAIGSNWVPGSFVDTFYSIPVFYYIDYNYQKKMAYYNILIVSPKYIVVVDSTNTFPAQYIVDNEVRYEKNYFGSLSAYAATVGSYGTTRFFLDVDSIGKIGSPKIIHSAAISVDKKALEDFNELKPKFKPAYENGIPINSSVEFDMKYDLYNETFMMNKTNYFSVKDIWGKASKNYMFFLLSGDSYKRYQKGKEKFMESKFETALENFKISLNYHLDNIELLYNIAITEIRLEKYVDACKDLETIKRVTIDSPYTSCITEQEIDELIKAYCTQE